MKLWLLASLYACFFWIAGLLVLVKSFHDLNLLFLFFSAFFLFKIFDAPTHAEIINPRVASTAPAKKRVLCYSRRLNCVNLEDLGAIRAPVYGLHSLHQNNAQIFIAIPTNTLKALQNKLFYWDLSSPGSLKFDYSVGMAVAWLVGRWTTRWPAEDQLSQASSSSRTAAGLENMPQMHESLQCLAFEKDPER